MIVRADGRRVGCLCTIKLKAKFLRNNNDLSCRQKQLGYRSGIGCPMLNRDNPCRAYKVSVSNRRAHQITDSESISNLIFVTKLMALTASSLRCRSDQAELVSAV